MNKFEDFIVNNNIKAAIDSLLTKCQDDNDRNAVIILQSTYNELNAKKNGGFLTDGDKSDFNSMKWKMLQLNKEISPNLDTVPGSIEKDSDQNINEDPKEYSLESELSIQFKLVEKLRDLPANHLLKNDFPTLDIPLDLINDAKENRIVLIECADKKLLHASTYTFIERYENQHDQLFEKKYLDGRDIQDRSTREQVGNKKLPIYIDLDLFKFDKSIENKIIVVDLLEGDLSRIFLDHMEGRYVEVENVKAELKSNNNLLIVKINGKENRDVLDDLKEYLWQVPFLSYYLEQNGYQHLEERLVIQQKNKSWDKDPYYFHNALKIHIANGTLEAKCEEIDLNGESTRTKKETIRQILEKEKKPLRRYLIFLIAFFGEISDEDFDYLLSTLVKDDKKLLKDYNKGYKKLLHNCFIQHTTNNEEDYIDMVLDFNKSEYRDQAIRYFFIEDFQFNRTQCNTLLQQGLLIQQEPSYSVCRNFIKLLSKVSRASTGYGIKLLKCVLASIYTGKTSVNMNTPEEDIYTIFKQKSDDDEFNIWDLYGYSVLALLIQEMLSHERLIQDVKQFYEILINYKLHNIAISVFDFIPHSSKIDNIGMEWLRRLINNGNDSIKEEAFKRLISLTPRNAEQLYDYLNRVREWLPNDTDPSTYSPANKFGLKFILNYLYRTEEIIGSPFITYGTHKSPYPLFGLFQNTELGSDDWMKKLIGWLFHPNIESAYNDQKEDISITKKRYYFDVATLIERWYAILHGLSREADYPDNLKIFDRIIEFIGLRIKEDRIIFQSLVHVWNQNARGYEAEIQYCVQIGKFITDVELKKAIEQNKQEVAARRYLLIEKFIPTIKKKLDPLVTNSQN